MERWPGIGTVRSGARGTKRGGSLRVALATLAVWGLLGGGAAAQEPVATGTGTLTGAVLDGDTRMPLGNVLVTVRAAADTTILRSQLTEATGRFAFAELRPGAYELSFRIIGYARETRTVTIGSGTEGSTSLGSVALAPNAIQIEPIEVLAERPAVVIEADRDIYAVEAMATAAGGTATDVLENIPDVELDLDGNVTVRGERPTIYINGRPAPMRGDALALFLQGFAAENIESVEVMTNPSARYEAEGTGGIVNLVLRRGASIGVNGNAFANAGSRGDVGIGGRATYMSGPVTIQGGTSLRLSRTETRSTEIRENLLADPVTYLEQERLSDRSNWSGNFDLSTEYALGDGTEVTGEVRVSRSSADAERFTAYVEKDADQDVTDEYDRLIADDGAGTSGNAAFEIEHEFDDSGRELSFEVQYQRGLDAEDSRIRLRTLEELGVIDPIDWATETAWEEDRETESEITLEIDFTQPVGDLGRLEIGGRSEFGSTTERRLEQVESGDGADPITTLDRGFTHDLVVHSAYVTGRRRIGGLNAQIGLRAEYADNRLTLPGEEGTYGNDGFSFFPNANVVYGFGDGKRVRLSYSMRVRRPSSSVLNPTNTSDDPMNRRIGNPSIEPQYTHSVNLDGSWSGGLGTIRISPFYRRSVNEWERITTVDEVGVSTSTYENLGETTTYGTSLNLSIRNFHGFGGSVDLNAQHRVSDWGAVLERAPESMTWWTLRTNLNARVSGSLNIQGSVQYNPARDLPQGRTASTMMTRLGIRQRLMDNRVTLNLNVTDPFEIYRPRTLLNDRSFSQTGRERPSARRLALSVSYNFGARGRGGGRGGRSGGGGPPGGFRGGD